MLKRHLQMVVSLLFASVLTACGGGGSSLPSTVPAMGTSATATSAFGSTRRAIQSTSGATDIAIDAGGGASGSWLADKDYSSSGFSGLENVAGAIDVSHATSPAPQTVYQTQRYGTNLTYTLPNLSPNTAYTVRLHFVESFFAGSGARLFNVSINGARKLTNFDIYAAAGGANIALIKSFSVTADTSGKIAIALVGTLNNASIAGIEVSTPSSSPTPAPAAEIAIDAGSTGASGNWAADTDFTFTGWGDVDSTTTAIDTSHATNPAPTAVYQTQRWAPNLTYTVPKLTPNGAYTVRLHFAETWWNAAGLRVFTTAINGTSVLQNFDIFQAAGGANIAIVKQFGVNADSTGTIVIHMLASVNNATIAALEILPASGSATPAPSPTPIASPAPSPTPVASGGMPWVYSSLWSTQSPLRQTVATLKSKGATAVSHTYMNNLWNQGVTNYGLTGGVGAGFPMYVSSASDPLLTVKCTMYGGGCNASGIQIHVNSHDLPQVCTGSCSDNHIIVIDQFAPKGAVEVDCWQTVLSSGSMACSWAGAYSPGTTGLHVRGNSGGSEGIHGGPAGSEMILTAQEIVNGHIDHALAMDTECLNNTTVFPADGTNGTDLSCDGSSNPPHYGNLIHLVTPLAQLQARGYSATCMVVLAAYQNYGAYLIDTGNLGLAIDTQSEASYTTNPATAAMNPWPGIQSALNAAGDGSGHNWRYCLQRLTANDFEMLQVAPQ